MWRKRKLFKFSIITIVLMLLLLELVFRIVFAVEYRGYHTSVYVQGNTLQMSDSLLIFKNRPFYLDYYKEYQFNEEGMRSEPGDVFMPEKKPGDFWVFLFGGSAMEGVGSNKDGEWLDITGVTDHPPGTTIAGYLQLLLRDLYPGKKVRVFNAANTGYSIYQSRLRYEQLAKKYQMDWVISMDGENEPALLKQGANIRDSIAQQWNKSPLFDFPLNTIIPITSHSAFVNKIKQLSFNISLSGRLKKNKKNNYPARRKWAGKQWGTLQYADSTAETKYAAQVFLNQLQQFDSLLATRKQQHLLYIQPHISLRDKQRMNETEKALYNYYTTSYNNPYNNLLRRMVHQRNLSSPNVRSLDYVHRLNKQVFVDYCHFTADANWFIAFQIAADIATGEKTVALTAHNKH
jgi:lysophospholipase L1-like esterase